MSLEILLQLISFAYCVKIVMQVSRQSRKFCPEALLFLRTLLNAALNEKQGLRENHEVCPHGL